MTQMPILPRDCQILCVQVLTYMTNRASEPA